MSDFNQNSLSEIVKLIKTLPKKDSLFETIIVSANDCLVENFLKKKIKFLDITKYLFHIVNKKEFQKYKQKKPINIEQIKSINKYKLIIYIINR